MDWHGLWTFLSSISIYVYLIVLFGGGALLNFLRNLHEARLKNKLAIEKERTQQKEYELEILREKNRPYNPKSYHPMDEVQPHQPYQQGYQGDQGEEIPPQLM